MTDLQAAAELADWLTVAGAVAQGTVKSNYQRIIAILREHAAEHPADDDEPIDEAWLLDCGFLPDAYGLELREPDTGWAIGVTDSHKRWEYMGREINPPKTRGQLRRLCAALGVRLT